MKVLFVTHTAQKYGAGRSMLALIDGLSSRGVSCHVILRQKGPLAMELDSRGIVNNVIPFKWWASNQKNLLKQRLRTISHPTMALLIARKAQTWGADVIHTNGSVTPVGALAARKAKIPHIWHIREFGKEDYGLTYDYGFERSAQMMADLSYRLVIISEALAEKYKPYVAPDKFEIVYNPVTLHTASISKPTRLKVESTPQVVTIGRLHPAKGFEDAILAVVQLLQRGRQIDLKIVGGGDPAYLASLRQLVHQNNAGSRVSFLGYVDDPGSILQTADIMLVCSRSEAFGRVTVEGMLHKKPIIAARAGASDELIKDNINGLQYDPGNFGQLAEKIEYLLDHPQRAEKMGKNGYRFAVSTFTKEQHIDAMYDIFSAAQNTQLPSSE